MDSGDAIQLFRITVLGATGCGKTSLINSFVNALCPARPPTTENVALYYRKFDQEEESYDMQSGTISTAVLEIEDTPGSDRAHEGSGNGPAAACVPAVQRGSRVRVVDDKHALVALFRDFRPQGKVRYKPGMDDMLGCTFVVKRFDKDIGVVSLPVPHDADGAAWDAGDAGSGLWDFPLDAVELDTSIAMPIDEYLQLDERPVQMADASLEKRRAFLEKVPRPFSAYQRPVGNWPDKTLTHHRMGFFLCFDLSDEEGASLLEIASVYKMLTEQLAKSQRHNKPIVFLVGCKEDKVDSGTRASQTAQAARRFAEREGIGMYSTSASRNSGVFEAFRDMATAIRMKRGLWNLCTRSRDGDDGDGGDGGAPDPEKCALQ
uniref:Uncharacterized protein n=1 Tax=Zooxanthella nutricula TaxID=1333877 RepID=A0A6U6L743_9DINO|mmetsp:Transcript_3040/g.9221  ORF Transcript_3040/g.9221 Transcript_3040/m.9221 type:complete len:376 (+) Transcript_3040:63-1190(+)